MTKAERFANAHGIKYQGRTLNLDGVREVVAFTYGKVRDVYADKACNYSYREFWF